MSLASGPATPEPWDGWERYPANLPASICHPFAYDLDFISEQLSRDSSRLFMNSNIQIRVIELGVKELTIKSTKALEDYFLEAHNFKGTRIFTIHQNTSWGPLTITSEAARKLLSSLQVFPEFLMILHKFGWRTSLQGDSHSSFRIVTHTQPESYECTYNLRYVEEHRREEERRNPWSQRQMGVYQKFEPSSGNQTFILLHTPNHLDARLARLSTQPGVKPSWQDIHLVLFSSSSRNWPNFVDWVDRQFQEKKLNTYGVVHRYAPSSRSTKKSDITITDAQSMEILRSRICDAKRHLRDNCTVISAINDILPHAYIEGGGAASLHDAQPRSITSLQKQHIQSHLELAMEHFQRLSAILELLESTSTLVRNISESHSLDALEENAYTATEANKRIETGNQLMFEIAKKSYSDAQTLKTITIVTLVYLPASFIAEFLGAGYVSLARSPGGEKTSLHVSKDIVIFIVLTTIFLIITLGAWRLMERRRTIAEARIDMSDYKNA